jgi:hypothetical protein
MDLRIGDAERDAVTEALHEHFAKGRLTREELDERLGSALSARTEGDLREIVRDLPDPHGLSLPVHRARALPARRHRHGPPPFVPFLLLFFLVATLTAGPAAGAFLALKVMVVFWLAAGVFAFVRLRRHLHTAHHHRH